MAVLADRIGSEQNAGDVWQHHLLHHHGEGDLFVGKPILLPIQNGPIGKQRRPAAAHGIQNIGFAAHVKVGVLLPGKGGVGQIFSSGAGADSKSGVGFEVV